MSEFLSYRLKYELKNHEADVRGVSCSYNNNLLSCSRDQTCRIWSRNRSDTYKCVAPLGGHSGFVSSVCYVPRNAEFTTGLVITASHDQSIRCYSYDPATFLFELSYHTSAVVHLAVSEYDTNFLLSASWDKSAVVWDMQTRKPKHILLGHSQAVWSVLQLSSGFLITGSADHSIIIFDKNGCYLKTLQGHTDCVRALCTSGRDCFLSTGNDGKIIHWAAPSGLRLWKIDVTEDYIYSITRIPGLNAFAWCGENGLLQIMRNSELQTIKVPAVSVWCVCALQNSDVAIGCSDGTIRIFSCDVSENAVGDDGCKYSLSQLPSRYPQGFRPYLNDLAGPEALLSSGKSEFDIKIVRQGLVAILYSWQSNSWQEVAKIVGTYVKQPKRHTHLDKGYDYVFNLKPSDTSPEISLPVNLQDDITAAATDVAMKNSIPEEYVSAIIALCINSIKEDFMALNIHFSGPEKYITSYFPASNILKFENANIKRVCAKLSEFAASEKTKDLYNLDTTLLSKVCDLPVTEYIAEPLSASVLSGLLQWPQECLFPVLDLLRLAVLNSNFISILLSDQQSPDFLSKMCNSLKDVTYPSNQVMILRALSNMMISEQGLSTVRERIPDVIKVLNSIQFPDDMIPQLQIALISFVHNLIVSTEKCPAHRHEIVQCLLKLSRFLNDRDSVFRCCIALGTYISFEGSTAVPKDILNGFHDQYDRINFNHYGQTCFRELLLILRGYDNQIGDQMPSDVIA